MSLVVEPRSLRIRVLARIFNAEPEEIPAMMLSFGFFFCVLCGYYIQRPIRDESGVLLGRDFISWAFTITFLVMLAAVPAFGWLVTHVARRLIVPVVYSVVLCVLAIFWALLATQNSNTYVALAFFVWVNVFVLFVVSLFWSFMSEIWRSDQAKRLYGAVSVGGSLGALTGPMLIQAFVRTIGVANLLLISAAFLALGLGFYLALRRLVGERNGAEPVSAPDKSGVLAGAVNVWKSPYLFRIALWTLAGTIFGNYFYLEQARIFGAEMKDRTESLEILSRVENGAVLLTMFFELFITGRLMQIIGVGRTMAIGPICAIAALIAVAVSPTVAVIATISVLLRALDYGMTGVAMRVLYTVVDDRDKYRAQNFNDTLVYRGGSAAGAWSFATFANYAAAAGFSAAPVITAVAVPAAIAWTWLALDLGARLDRAIGRGDSAP